MRTEGSVTGSWSEVPPERERTPLLDEAGRRMLQRLREHPDAPRWTYAVGDRLVAADLPTIERYRRLLVAGAVPSPHGVPSPVVLQDLAHALLHVPRYRASVPDYLDLERDWHRLPTTCRADLATAPWDFVPDDQPLDRLVIYRTAGTTGHPIAIPHHPWSVACYLPMLEHALAAHRVHIDPGSDTVACALLSFQVMTYTYSTVLSAWAGSGFVKVNLRPTDWPSPDSPARYLADLAPQIVTGEPVVFSELLRLGVRLVPRAMVSTSLAMPAPLRANLQQHFGCPVLDWYSMVETGPIACSCPAGNGLHLLGHDVFVEMLSTDGSAVAPGQRGEITVSGGRNPFLPLLRYRTGDFGRLDHAPCPCGDPMPRIVDLVGRPIVVFRASDGTPVGPVDISRALRELPILHHAFVQHVDGSCELTVQPRPGAPAPDISELAAAVRSLFGTRPCTINLSADLPPGEPPFRCELPVGR
jgi:phenylacetate-CoA ligase